MFSIRTLALAAVLVGGAAALPLGRLFLPHAAAARALDGNGALGTYLATQPSGSSEDAPRVYLELFDLGGLEQVLSDSGLGRLVARLAGPEAGGAGWPGGRLAERFGLDARALVRGERSWEDSLALALYQLGHEHLGLDRREALRVAAALGKRFSLALDPGGERLAVSWSLRQGGQELLADLVDEHLVERGAPLAPGGPALTAERSDPQGAGQLYRLALEGVSLETGGDAGAYLILRPDLMAFCTDPAWARALADAGPADRADPGPGELARARAAALEGGAPLWARLDGSLLAGLARGEAGRAACARLGLDGVRSVELSLGGRGGQLASRVRVELEPGPRRGLFALLGEGTPDWSGLERLTADTFLVAGLARAPGDAGRDLCELIATAADAPTVRGLWERVAGAPLLRELAAPGATGDEALFFLRPGSLGLPSGYLTLPAGPALLERLASLPEAPAAAPGALSLETTELEGARCWRLARGEASLALMHTDGALVAAPSLLALRDYARGRQREDPERRRALIDAVAAELGRASQDGDRRLAGFAHVRTAPLVEAVWPWVLMGLSLRGGGDAEGLEALPDAYELAEEIGDTTLLLFDDGDAVELSGRGLFGGLGVLF